MISELGRRLAADLDAPSRARVGRSIEPPRDEDPDFALSLSSESLRIAEERAPSGARPSPSPSAEPARIDFLESMAPTEPTTSGPARRVIEAYREIARAPTGERIRIVV